MKIIKIKNHFINILAVERFEASSCSSGMKSHPRIVIYLLNRKEPILIDLMSNAPSMYDPVHQAEAFIEKHIQPFL